MRHLPVMWIFLAAVVAAVDAVANRAPGYPNAQFLVETQELASWLGRRPELRIIDARDPGSYQEGHLPGAVNLPAGTTDDLGANRQGFPLPLTWAQRLLRIAGITVSSRLVVYDEQGNLLAARVFYFLEFFGNSHVAVLNGGLKKWKAEGRAVTMDVPHVPEGDFAPAPNPPRGATSDWLVKNLNNPQVVIVDARSPAEYRGERGVDSRGGHVPGAVNIPWNHVLTPGESQTFLPAAALRQVFAELKITPDRQVVTYCRVGTRAADIYFALRLLGFKQVRLYDGGMGRLERGPQAPGTAIGRGPVCACANHFPIRRRQDGPVRYPGPLLPPPGPCGPGHPHNRG